MYDAWGNLTTTSSKNNFFTDASLFKYRGYIYDWDTGFYYLQSRYYDPEVGRFINADGYINANSDIIGYNMYAYCSNNPVNFVDPKGGFAEALAVSFFAKLAAGFVAVAPVVAVVVLAVAVVATTASLVYTAVENNKAEKAEEKEKEAAIQREGQSQTYYHITTPEAAAAIMASGVMIGSPWESGYVFAWRQYPDTYAVENSGAHFGVIISFSTSAYFSEDNGIEDEDDIKKYGPVKSLGPIQVWDVKVVGYTE